jgi:dienelactone hydrolase
VRKLIACLPLLACLSLHAQELPADLRAAVAEHAAAPTPPLLARKNLYPENAVQFAELAPDGRFVANGVRQGLITTLSLLDTQTLASTPLFTNDRIRQVQWASDSSKLYLEMDTAIGVVALDALAKPEYIARLDRVADDYVLGLDASSPDHVLLVRQAEGNFMLERVSTRGESETLLTTDKQIDQALATPDVLYLVLHDAAGRAIYRLAEGALSEVLACGTHTLSECDLLAWNAAEQTLWLKTLDGGDLAGLFEWSPVTGELRELHTDPLRKTDLYATALRGALPFAMAYDAGLYHYSLDASMQPALTDLHALLPGSLLELSIGANDTWLVKESNAVLRESRSYLFYAAERRLERILETSDASAAPAPDQLARKYFIEYSASDGVTIPAYVSFPKGVDIASAPLVALIHGGPWGRVSANYVPTTQLLANRGYIVFEPNFRASAGYGQQHVVGANRDFGNGRVQQDITDGVEWLLAQGIGARDKVAIVGGSFGGFSVLAGLAFTPTLYKVGIAMVPPADLAATLRYSMAQPTFVYRNPSLVERMKLLAADFTDPADMQRLYNASPLASLHTITAPVLLVAGADDDRIDIKHVKDYALRLLNQGNALSLLIDEDEGHNFFADEASEATLYLVEEMLALHLGGRKQGLDDDVLRKYLADRFLLNTVPGFLPDLTVSAP